VDRSGGTIDFRVPVFPLLTLKIEAYEPDECPLCKVNIPITKPGSSDKK
jgi:orotate phosphoribosyltransferase